ncbi:hypothetical protein NM688_g8014 [Phlebia brevispora]|uniref:Uncharacterized protein n=1 Tax=Phlebia brevispora TaxID=194682 RepID=A0ACC1RZ21_9APHY|nr:hypothetical protein NM688_g8014 [Phlebia brevispora]
MRSYFALLAALLPTVLADTYSISDTYIGQDFLNSWTHEAIQDPTNGRVNYVDQATALAENLTYANGDTLVLRADYWTMNPPDPGRSSVRIRSNNVYSTHVVVSVTFLVLGSSLADTSYP